AAASADPTMVFLVFFFSSRRRHTRSKRDWSSDVCSSDLIYRSETLQHACAQLGITLAHTSPYDPKAKGKIERVFKTIQTRFYPRSEERRVGKEGRSGGARERRERKRTRDQRAVSGERRRG